MGGHRRADLPDSWGSCASPGDSGSTRGNPASSRCRSQLPCWAQDEFAVVLEDVAGCRMMVLCLQNQVGR